MCGIIYAKNLKGSSSVNSMVKVLYQNQRERGQQGFGFVGLNAERIDTYRATSEKGIVKYLNEYQYSEVLLHHRFPTSTPNTLRSTHPFVIERNHRRYYFVHNGIIHNADELREAHKKRNITYVSEEGAMFNDSEALAWDFCLWLSNEQGRMEAAGSVAFVCLEVNKKTNRAQKLYFYRNEGAPLKVYKDKTVFILTSSGGFRNIRNDWLYFWDYQERQVRRWKLLDIQVSQHFSLYDYDDDTETELEAILYSLEQEKNHLISIGRYAEAEAIEDEIRDLKCRYFDKALVWR